MRPTEYLYLACVEDGSWFAGDMFRRAFNDALPDYGRHVVCLYRKNPEHFLPLGYVNFLPWEGQMLVGGGVTAGRQAFAHVEEAHRQEIRALGGILYLNLRFGFARFHDECEAFFGHAGNPRALEVDLRAGFVLTHHEHLIVHWHKPVAEARKSELIERVHALGSF